MANHVADCIRPAVVIAKRFWEIIEEDLPLKSILIVSEELFSTYFLKRRLQLPKESLSAASNRLSPQTVPCLVATS